MVEMNTMTLTRRGNAVQNMKNCNVAPSSASWRTAALPSLEVPVNESNRALLRFLRAAEVAAWEDSWVGMKSTDSRGV